MECMQFYLHPKLQTKIFISCNEFILDLQTLHSPPSCASRFPLQCLIALRPKESAPQQVCREFAKLEATSDMYKPNYHHLGPPINICFTLGTVMPKQPSGSQTSRSPPDNRYAILNGTL